MAHARKKRSGRPRGGVRKGAGRPKGVPNAVTSMKRATIAYLAKQHTEEALETIVGHMRNSKKTPELSQRAAEYLLNRVYGTPKQAVNLGFIDESGEDEGDCTFTMKFTRRDGSISDHDDQ